jgi:photosystem II stability/assembly factor-like uncharacterized protein
MVFKLVIVLALLFALNGCGTSTAHFPLIRGVAYFDGHLAWIITDHGDLVRVTIDGSSEQRANLNTVVRQASFIRPEKGWIVDKSGRLWSTSDGGMTWERLGGIDWDPVEPSSQLQFVTEKIGFLQTSDFLLLTESGGREWKRIFPDDLRLKEESEWMRRIAIADTSSIWIGLSGGKVYRTTDRGNAWVNISLPSSQEMRDLSTIDQDDCWAATIDALFYTADSGRNWRRIAVPQLNKDYFISSIFFTGRDLGWLVLGKDDGGLVYKTEDGGKTWMRSSTDFNLSLNNIYFTDRENGILTSDSAVFITNDAGKTWREIFSVSESSE